MGSGGLDGTPALTVTLMVVLFSVGSGTRDSGALVGAVGVGCLLTIAILRDPDARFDLGDLVLPILVVGGAWLAGLALRIRHDREQALEKRAAALERDRDALALAAVADERVRIGRELHDVVAHAIGVIVVQARGGRASLSTDPAATREALDAIETTGVQALNEMHRLVEIIRSDDERASLSPPPGLRDLDRLVDQVREAGLPVDFAVEGTPTDVAPGVDLSAYRIVQEALTNALKYAGPARAWVTVRWRDRELELEIANDGSSEAGGDGRGHGLAGLRERVALVGGSIESGPRAGGGFVVTARLPYGGSA
jgi:signal transduction histidine kinase